MLLCVVISFSTKILELKLNGLSNVETIVWNCVYLVETNFASQVGSIL